MKKNLIFIGTAILILFVLLFGTYKLMNSRTHQVFGGYSSPSDKIKYIKENIQPGSIILMHPWYGDTAEELIAIEGILKFLTDKGYTFVTVNTLQEMQTNN
jgi:peptidoglycan/xylan/chitin deacetylase (PgdA/CDA1 family)